MCEGKVNIYFMLTFQHVISHFSVVVAAVIKSCIAKTIPA